MKTYGLIGFPLSHSFSKKYFSEKFLLEEIAGCEYENFPIESIGLFKALLENNPGIQGLNVTIPYKERVIPFIDRLDPAAAEIAAVNVIKREKDGTLTGYNSDYYGFKHSLVEFLQNNLQHKALVLGTGGAGKAVITALNHLHIPFQFVSRTAKEGVLSYQEIDEVLLKEYTLIINTSPLGMYPNVDTCPDIPYQFLTSAHYLYDLVYNPEETLFMKKGKEKGAHTINGLPMLIGQAEKAWEIWNG